MFNEWFDGNLDIYRLNFAMITSIPKENDARSMKKFRLISCSFYKKIVTNRYALVIGRVISSCQSSFIIGRFILESVCGDLAYHCML
jgi:hypothetical protein